MRRGLLGLVLGGCVFACRGPLDVSVDAHYEAPRTAVRAQVVGLGRVHAGSDTASDARVQVRLCPTIAGPEPIDLTLDPAAAQIRWTMQAHDGRAPWTWDQASATLQARLREAGYPTVDPREVDALDVMLWRGAADLLPAIERIHDEGDFDLGVGPETVWTIAREPVLPLYPHEYPGLAYLDRHRPLNVRDLLGILKDAAARARHEDELLLLERLHEFVEQERVLLRDLRLPNMGETSSRVVVVDPRLADIEDL